MKSTSLCACSVTSRALVLQPTRARHAQEGHANGLSGCCKITGGLHTAAAAPAATSTHRARAS